MSETPTFYQPHHILLLKPHYSITKMANWEQLNFQNRNSPLIEQLIFIHDHIISILILIMALVSYMIILFITNKRTTHLIENHELEILWTFIPGATLILIAFPSLRILYIREENEKCPISIKVIGHQWYWTYEYSNFKEIEFDSFIIPTEKNIFRLLETDNNLWLPNKTFSNVFISSSDVLHSWTVPSIRIKIDASPGRLNAISLFCYKPGIFFGQCSEICGTNHRFIPISLLVSNNFLFKKWLITL